MSAKQSTVTPAAQPEIHGTKNIASVVHELWERTADQLSRSELEWFADATESAVMTMQNLEEVMEGIGCLVNADESDNCATGSFQTPQSTSALLFFLAESVRHARALVTVGDAANYRLRHPELYRQTPKP